MRKIQLYFGNSAWLEFLTAVIFLELGMYFKANTRG